jgi:cullin-associated NEDD8-dissociated protein 1
MLTFICSGSDYSMKLKNLMNKITATPSLAEKYNSVLSE